MEGRRVRYNKSKKVDKAGLSVAARTDWAFSRHQMNGPPVMAARAFPFSAAARAVQKQIFFFEGPRTGQIEPIPFN